MAQTAPAEPDIEQLPATAPAHSRMPSWARSLLPVVAVLGGTALIAWRGSVYGSWIVDDAAISFAYARDLADGLGPVVMPGAAPVEGFSNPAWTALLALGKLVGLFDNGTLFGVPDYVVFPKGLALLCCAGMLALVYRAASRVTGRAWLATLATGAALAAIPSFVIWCFSGLENALYALLVLGLGTVLFRGALDGRLLRPRVAALAGVLAALAALTRPDGLIYAAAYPLVALVLLRRGAVGVSVRCSALALLGFLLPYGGYELWRWVQFGSLLPNTSVAKSQSLPHPADLLRTGYLATYLGGATVLVCAAVIGVALVTCWWRNGLLALLVPLGLAVVAFAVIEPDWMGNYRFATPVWALLAPSVVLAAGAAFRACAARGRALLVVATVVGLVSSGFGSWHASSEFRAKPTLPVCYIADRIGRTFNAYADILHLRQASLLTPDLGGSSLTSRLRLVDMAGLASVPVARYIHDRNMAGLRNYVFDRVQPTFIHSRGPWGPGNRISSDSRILRDYYQVVSYGRQLGRPAGDWVRKDAVPDQATLLRLLDYAGATVRVIDRRQGVWPLRHCGDELRPGQTRVNQAS